MRITRHIKTAVLLSSVAFLAGSCMEEELDIVNVTKCDPSEVICFSAEMTGTPVSTRGTLGHLGIEDENWEVENVEAAGTKSAPVTELSGFAGITAVTFTGEWKSVTDFHPNTDMVNDKFTFSDGGALSPTAPRAWRNVAAEHNVKFFAYAPWCDQTTVSPEIDLSETSVTSCPPYLTYTANETVASQKDLLYAVSETISGSSKTSVPLTFRHALSAVQFKLGFDCKVQSLSVHNVCTAGKFALAGSDYGWSELATKKDFSFTIGDTSVREAGSTIIDGDETLMMIPQSFANNSADGFNLESDPYIKMVYIKDSETKTIISPLASTSWTKGRKIIYTIYETEAPKVDYIYFDLAAGNVEIPGVGYEYKGYVFVDGEVTEVKGTHANTNKYYVYQSNVSTESSVGYKTKTGYATEEDFTNKNNCRIPQYPAVMYDANTTWADYITNNSSVEDVIVNWRTAAKNAGREASPATDTANKVYSAGTNGRQIKITGTSGTYDIVLDNIWSSYEGTSTGKQGAINIASSSSSQIYLRLKGDNRFSNIQYCNSTKNLESNPTGKGFLRFTSLDGDKSTEGSLTVAFLYTYPEKGVYHSDRQTAIGDSSSSNCYGIHFDGGTVFVGMGKIYNQLWESGMGSHCTAVIGGTPNQDSEIFVTGGRLTAVSGSSAAALGGSGGHDSRGGNGDVYIEEGEVYAYAHSGYHTAYQRIVPVTAIGGGCSSRSVGQNGVVKISGGYVYAESAGGCAIGGGNAAGPSGGSAEITITGGTVVAVSKGGSIGGHSFDPGVAIGGGNGGIDYGANGGKATVRISGGNITAGSVGGGSTNNTAGKIGSADVKITGGVFSGQFLLSAGSGETPKFVMEDGTIKNSTATDATKFVKQNGGAVYMETGTCTISGGTITGCSAEYGGAVYMTSANATAPVCNISGGVLQSNSAKYTGGAVYIEDGTFNMSGGELLQNSSESDGGAVYVSNGNVTMTKGVIKSNLTTDGNGGGVCIVGGSFTMDGAESDTKIINNTANFSNASPYTGKGGNGGGIYLASETSDPLVDIRRGTIQENSADYNGGGIFVDMSQTGNTHTARVNIGTETGTHTTTSPYIYQNTAGLSGGGMSIQGAGSDIYIYSGTVNGNVSAYVLNQDIRNDGGTMHLIGTATETDVDCVTITFHGNNDTDPEDTATQRVVTCTNSLLVPPSTAFTREFYTQTGWNSKRDGSGDEYTLDGKQVKVAGSSSYVDAVMNLSANIDLYAQWVEN